MLSMLYRLAKCHIKCRYGISEPTDGREAAQTDVASESEQLAPKHRVVRRQNAKPESALDPSARQNHLQVHVAGEFATRTKLATSTQFAGLKLTVLAHMFWDVSPLMQVKISVNIVFCCCCKHLHVYVHGQNTLY